MNATNSKEMDKSLIPRDSKKSKLAYEVMFSQFDEDREKLIILFFRILTKYS